MLTIKVRVRLMRKDLSTGNAQKREHDILAVNLCQQKYGMVSAL